jgi:hypothetical protein
MRLIDTIEQLNQVTNTINDLNSQFGRKALESLIGYHMDESQVYDEDNTSDLQVLIDLGRTITNVNYPHVEYEHYMGESQTFVWRGGQWDRVKFSDDVWGTK